MKYLPNLPRLIIISNLAVSACLLAACGQRGPLYLPTTPASPIAAPAQPASTPTPTPPATPAAK